MGVGTYALTSLDEAKAYLGNVVAKDGLWVFCSASDATAATAQVSATTLTLIITGGTSAGTTTLTLSGASYDTVTELVAGINAAAGWAAGAIYNGGADSSGLLVTGALSCLGAANELTLKIEDTHLIEALIDRASDLVERYCNRKFVSRSYTNERYWGTGTRHLLLGNYPVTRVSAVKAGRTEAFQVRNTTATSSAYIEVTDTIVRLTANGTTTDLTIASYATITLLVAAINATSGWGCTTPASDVGTMKASDILPNYGARYCRNEYVDVEIPDDYVQEYYLDGGVDETRGSGILLNPTGWMSGIEYFIAYTAGYTTTPYALEMACLELVKYKWDAGETSGIYKSQTLGDYSFTLADLPRGIPDQTLKSLDMFRRCVL